MVEASTVCNSKKDFLHRQTRDWLVQQMRTGKLTPGAKLPGERALADKLKISRGTARNALQQLEDEGMIERIPSRGAFISQQKEMRAIKIALVFPELAISREYLGYSNWVISLEVQRGLFEGGIEFNSELSFVHCRVADDPVQYAERLVKDFDGAVFLSRQLEDLHAELRKSKFPFVLIGYEKMHPSLTYNRQKICEEAAQHLLDCGCCSTQVLLGDKDSPTFSDKRSAIEKVFHKNISILVLDANEEKAYEKLRQSIPDDKSLLPKAFFCTTPVVSFALLRLANERNWNIPDDFMVMGYDNDMNIRPTIPLLTHVRVPHYEMGKVACKLLADKILNNKEIPDTTVVPAELIIGRSTR